MQYQKIHDSIIDRAKIRIYDKKIHHKHHIIPKHENKLSKETVPLTLKEHILIHHLRWKIAGTIGNKLAYLLLSGSGHEAAALGGKLGGAQTKLKDVGIFSKNYSRSAETKRRWKDCVITKECLNMTTPKMRDRGLASVKSKSGIFHPDYDRSLANKEMWNNLSKVERKRRSRQFGNMAKMAGDISYKKKFGFHGLSAEEKIKNASLGGLATAKITAGQKWIHKNKKRIRINPNELNDYLNNGWIKGLGKHAK